MSRIHIFIKNEKVMEVSKCGLLLACENDFREVCFLLCLVMNLWLVASFRLDGVKLNEHAVTDPDKVAHEVSKLIHM